MLVACDAGVKPDPPPTPAPPKSVEPPVVIGGMNLAYLAADSDLLVHIDVAALRRGKLWPTYENHIANLLLPRLACSYAPVRDITTVEVGVTLETGVGVFVVRGIDRDKTLKCLHEGAGAHVGDYVIVTDSHATDILTFVDATTMVVQRGKQPTRDTLAKVLHDGNAPLATDQTFAAAIKRLPTQASITTVSRPNSKEMRSKWKQMGIDFHYFFGSLDVTDKPELAIQVQLAMVVGSAAQATQFTTMMQSQLKSAQVNQMFDGFDVTASGDTTSMKIAMSETKLASLVRMIDQLMPLVRTDPQVPL